MKRKWWVWGGCEVGFAGSLCCPLKEEDHTCNRCTRAVWGPALLCWSSSWQQLRWPWCLGMRARCQEATLAWQCALHCFPAAPKLCQLHTGHEDCFCLRRQSHGSHRRALSQRGLVSCSWEATPSLETGRERCICRSHPSQLAHRRNGPAARAGNADGDRYTTDPISSLSA